MTTLTPFEEAVQVIVEAGGEPLRLCYQCGLCTGTCPWNMVRSFPVRKIMGQSQLGLIDFESEDNWMCTSCHACVDRCPRGVEIIDVMRALRRAMVGMGFGHVPKSLEVTLKNIAAIGNPYGESKEKRMAWTKGRDVKTFSKEMDFLFFACCFTAYDAKIQRAAQAGADVLNALKASYGVLGAELSCCGESVRKAGDESLMQSLARDNTQVFTEKGVKKIVVNSPHCYYTFKNEYPEVGGNFEAIHMTQYLAQMIEQGKLKFTKSLNKRVTYHDPCYLGRHSGIYDEPRKVLKSIPGLELVEMKDNRELALCCGGGGGRIWMETKKGERFSDIRLNQAIETGAEILAVACPYCMSNFEDSLLSSEKGSGIEIKDIAELAREAI
ncbi:MAG: (Fe-S)-binding protein [Dehalococcoidia bacterium]|nr:(Fe-S)-binding protein [Dehalococcoidia bacterium]